MTKNFLAELRALAARNQYDVITECTCCGEKVNDDHDAERHTHVTLVEVREE